MRKAKVKNAFAAALCAVIAIVALVFAGAYGGVAPARADGTVDGSAVTYTLSETNVSFTEYSGVSFTFKPTAAMSYDVEITAADGTVWSTAVKDGAATGAAGYRGSGLIKNNANASASAQYANVFENVAAGDYTVYVPFEFFRTVSGEGVITNPVFKAKGYTDEYGLQTADGEVAAPTEIQGAIRFVAASSDGATALNAAISDVTLCETCPLAAELNMDSAAITSAIDGYGIIASRKTAAFTAQNATLRWTGGTGMDAAAGVMLKFGNTGANDVRVRFGVSENSGREFFTESYSGAKSETEYYRFIHSADSVKAKGTEDKLYVYNRKAYVPAGYQGIMLLPFSRLRYQISYRNDTETINGRLNGTLGRVALYVDNITADAAGENGLTFYALNMIKAVDGKGVSFKAVGSGSGSDVAAEGGATVTTTPSVEVKASGAGAATVTVDKTALFVGQTVNFTVVNNGATVTPSLFAATDGGVKDIGSKLVKVSDADGTTVYSYRKTSQSDGVITFSLKETVTVEVKDADGNALITDVCGKGENYVVKATAIAKPHYDIVSVTVGDEPLTANSDGDYVIENVSEAVSVKVGYAAKRYAIAVTTEGEGSYEFTSGSGFITHFESATIKLTAAKGYKIASVTVNGEAAEYEDGLAINAPEDDVNIAVTFAKIVYDVKTEITGNGTAAVDKTALTIDESYELSVVAAVGSVVSEVKVNGETVELSDGKYAGVCDGTDVIVSVTFRKLVYKVTVNCGEGGVAKAISEVGHGENVMLSFAANDGYELASVTINGKAVETNGESYVIANCTGDVTITVEWRAVEKTSNLGLILAIVIPACVVVAGAAAATVILIKKRKNK